MAAVQEDRKALRFAQALAVTYHDVTRRPRTDSAIHKMVAQEMNKLGHGGVAPNGRFWTTATIAQELQERRFK